MYIHICPIVILTIIISIIRVSAKSGGCLVNVCLYLPNRPVGKQSKYLAKFGNTPSLLFHRNSVLSQDFQSVLNSYWLRSRKILRARQCVHEAKTPTPLFNKLIVLGRKSQWSEGSWSCSEDNSSLKKEGL